MSFTLARNMNKWFQDLQFRLDRGDYRFGPNPIGSELVRRRMLVFKGVYDFSVQGGATGTVALYDAAVNTKQALILPAGFIISKVLIDVLTQPIGVSGTLALTSGQSAADLLAATGVSSLPVGLLDGIPTTAAASNIKVPLTQANPGSTVSAVIATTPFTAGKINVFITGFLSD